MRLEGLHIEVIEALRCIAPHDETWLVATIDAWEGRRIMRGSLGCPVCGAVYPVRDGVADFTGAAGRSATMPEGGGIPVHDAQPAAGSAAATGPGGGAPGSDAGHAPGGEPSVDAADDAGVFRLAAQLDLREPGGVVLLDEEWRPLADALANLAPAHYVIVQRGVVAPRPAVTGARASPASAVRAAGSLPFRAATVRGAALGPHTSSPPLLDEAVRALRPGGRLVAPAGALVPAGVTLLAHDARQWVAVRAGEAWLAPVSLERRR